MPPRRQANTSERRKRQNAESQRIYRAKQKERMQALEQLAASALAGQRASTSTPMDTIVRQPTGGGFLPLPDEESPPLPDFEPPLLTASLARYLDFGIFFSFARDEMTRCLRILASEHFTLRDIVKYGLIDMGYGMEDALFDEALTTPAQDWIRRVRSCYYADQQQQQQPQPLDMAQVTSRGIRLLARLHNPPQWPVLPLHGQEHEYQGGAQSLAAAAPRPSWSSPTVVPRTMSFSVQSLLAAQLLNMQRLGMTPDMLFWHTPQSIFHPATSSDQANDDDGSTTALAVVQNPASAAAAAEDYYSHLPPDLRPTPVQLAHNHYPYLDLIPWPGFRSRVIAAHAAAGAGGRLPREYRDLCLDLANDGVRCWGNTGGVSMAGRGEGMPWDSRSWEAAPWFLDKYRGLTGGEEGDIARTSAWWRGMRGER